MVRELAVVQPRGFGYLLGDRFERTVTMAVRAPYRLDREALPSGRLGDWLELAPPRVDSERDGELTRYVIHFVYQLINVDPGFREIAVPHHELVYTDGTDSGKVLVPATRVGVTMLRPPGSDSLQPAHAPAPLRFDPTRLWICALLAVAAVAALAWLRWGLPGGSRTRPFAIAARELAALGRRAVAGDVHGDALRMVHRAFDATAGRTVFPETLDAFFADHARFAGLRDPITLYFAHSRRYFFEDGNDDAYPYAELVDLVERCRDVERGLG
ncbi:MAG: nonribosomal peptide synthetase MxaA [Gammaproteobacteria bacterium]|nr:nonribosomal peptide synthetase MxaA [Gammaproteobacteria bacterium]